MERWNSEDVCTKREQDPDDTDHHHQLEGPGQPLVTVATTSVHDSQKHLWGGTLRERERETSNFSHF